jgi:hypothetical protein
MDHQRSTSADDGSLGTSRTWTSQNASVPVAVWSGTSKLAQDFYGGIKGDFVIAAGSDLGVKAQDRFTDGTYYYQVNGWLKYANSAVSAETLYLIDVTRRTV